MQKFEDELKKCKALDCASKILAEGAEEFADVTVKHSRHRCGHSWARGAQMFNGLACFLLGVFMLFLHDISFYKVTVMFTAVDCFFWGVVYFVFACCAGDFSLTVGLILGTCIGPVCIAAGPLLNWLLGPGHFESVDGLYGWSLVAFGIPVFLMNVCASTKYRGTGWFRSGLDRQDLLDNLVKEQLDDKADLDEQTILEKDRIYASLMSEHIDKPKEQWQDFATWKKLAEEKQKKDAQDAV